MLSNLEAQSLFTVETSVPLNKKATITLELYNADFFNGGALDVSPSSSYAATILYDPLDGSIDVQGASTMWKANFGFVGYVSGVEDPTEYSYKYGDVEPYSNYYDDIERAGINIESRQDVRAYSEVSVQILGEGTQTTVKKVNEAVIFSITDTNNETKNIVVLNVNPLIKSQLEDQLDGKSATIAIMKESKSLDPVYPIRPPLDPEIPTAVMSGQEVSPDLPKETISSSSFDVIETELDRVNADYVILSTDKSEPDAEVWFAVVQEDSKGNHLPPSWRMKLKKFNSYKTRENDDADGDGVPNLVELMIGKNPVKRDVLGIELTVSVEWDMSEEDKKNLIYSIRKASDFVYDYTDGYAMITKITVWDRKRNWEEADVRVHYTHPFLPQTPAKIFYDGWPQATIGGYWIGGSIMMSKEFERFSEPGGAASIGSVRWGRTLGHELGHYIFWLGDEYEDWNDTTYLGGYMTCDDFACYPNWELYNAAPLQL